MRQRLQTYSKNSEQKDNLVQPPPEPSDVPEIQTGPTPDYVMMASKRANSFSLSLSLSLTNNHHHHPIPPQSINNGLISHRGPHRPSAVRTKDDMKGHDVYSWWV